MAAHQPHLPKTPPPAPQGTPPEQDPTSPEPGRAEPGGVPIAAEIRPSDRPGGDAGSTATGGSEELATTPMVRLHLLQLVSPALPVGAFSYAEGLEVLVQGGRLADGTAMLAWLEAELERGAVRLEVAALPKLMALLGRWQELAGRHDPAAAECERLLRDRDGWLLAQREAPELRAQQRQMGRSLLQLLADLGWPLPDPLPLAWPAAFAWAGHCLAIPATALVEAYLYGWVANQLSAAVRLVPLGPTEAQRLQLALAPAIARQAALLVCADPEELWSAGVGAGMAQLRHAELYSRLFRS